MRVSLKNPGRNASCPRAGTSPFTMPIAAADCRPLELFASIQELDGAADASRRQARAFAADSAWRRDDGRACSIRNRPSSKHAIFARHKERNYRSRSVANPGWRARCNRP